jgi:hypothetical protein
MIVCGFRLDLQVSLVPHGSDTRSVLYGNWYMCVATARHGSCICGSDQSGLEIHLGFEHAG